MNIIKTTNKACRAHVINREAFKASNMFSENYKGLYIVYSYGHHFPMYVWNNGTWYGNKDKYSLSTTRHTQSAMPAPRNTITWVTTNELKDMTNN